MDHSDHGASFSTSDPGCDQSPPTADDDARDRRIVALEARIRALEYVLSNLPEVTAGVLHAATHDVGLRVPDHPLESEYAPHSIRAKLADLAIAELWKHKR